MAAHTDFLINTNLSTPNSSATSEFLPTDYPADPQHRNTRAAERRVPGLAMFAVSAALVVSLAVNVAGGLFARSLVDQRDTALADAQTQLDQLSRANIAFQAQVVDLAAVRDGLSSDLTARTNERDTLSQQLYAATQRADNLNSQLANAQSQVRQAAQDSANQQQRADNADARGAAIKAVLGLDDQIYREFGNYDREVSTMNQATRRYDYFSAYAAYARSQVVSDRITGLFGQRAGALAKV